MKTSNRRGQGTIEYGLILVLIALVSISTCDTVSNWVHAFYGGVSTAVQSAN